MHWIFRGLPSLQLDNCQTSVESFYPHQTSSQNPQRDGGGGTDMTDEKSAISDIFDIHSFKQGFKQITYNIRTISD